MGSEGWAVPRAVFAAFFTLEVTAGLGVSAWGCHCPHWGSQLPVPGGDAGMQLQWQSHGSSASAWELQELSADPSVPALFCLPALQPVADKMMIKGSHPISRQPC